MKKKRKVTGWFEEQEKIIDDAIRLHEKKYRKKTFIEWLKYIKKASPQ